MALRIAEMSDLHEEFGKHGRIPPLPHSDDYDVVMLPGDIGLGINGLLYMDEIVPKDKPIVTCNGNHEYYKNDYYETQASQRALIEKWKDRRTIHLLNPGTVEINGVVIIGATLWSSLELQGYYDHRINDLLFERSIADFKLIRTGDTRWDADKHREEHQTERKFIIDALKANAGKKCVVMTHFVPAQMCIDPIYANSPLNPYFTVDMDDVMLDYTPEAWYFGHTHSKMEMVHPSGTKLICNPAGYPGEHRRQNEWVIHSF